MQAPATDVSHLLTDSTMEMRAPPTNGMGWRKIVPMLLAMTLSLECAGAPFQESGGQVVMEAENYEALNVRTDPNGVNWQSGTAVTGYVGDGYIDTPTTATTIATWSDGCEVSYAIDFSTTGTYVVWVRRYAVDDTQDSSFYGLDGAQGTGVDNATPYGSWTWKNRGTITVSSAGEFTFQLRRREKGYKVDRILLTTDTGFTPSGDGPAESPQSATYDDVVAGFAPNVVSYWKFENTGADEQGIEGATITGSPELTVPTIVDLDTIAEGAAADGEVIAWSGVTGEYAEAAHNAAHKTAAGTIVVTFQSDQLSEKSTLVAADSNGAAGGLSVEVTTNGSPRAFLKNASGSAVVLAGQSGDIQLDQAYTQIFKWGTGGLSLALYDAAGTLVRRVTNALTDGVTGTSTIRFGAWHTDVSHHDGPYGRVVWLNRRISDIEEAELARAKTITRGAPAAPSGLSATAVSSSQIDLAWTDNASDETGFKIERKTGAGGTYGQIDTTGANTTTYDDTGLEAGTTFFYQVRATNASGDSAYSNEDSATTDDETYDGLVTRFAPDVVSYWKFQNSGTDEQGTQNATMTGSPELNVPTIVDLDTIAEGAPADGEVIAWSGGTGEYAEAAHNAAHKTAAGTIVVTFQSDQLSEKSTLVAADSNSAAGGLSVEVNTDGSSRAFLKNASGSAVILTGQAGDVQLNQAYTQIFKWGTGGLSLALYNDAGTLVRRVTNALTDGVTGTSTIRFGAWHTGTFPGHDGPYGRVIWLDRRISDAEEADLARAKTIARGGDTEAPTVSVTSPANGANVAGTIPVTASASDNVGVVGVQFKVDGVNLGAEDTTSPYSANWDTTAATDGSHSLTAVARDAADNSTTSTAVNVTVDNAAPTVSVTAPTNGASVAGTSVTVSADASDNMGIVGVQFKLDGVNLGAEDTTSPYSVNWDTTAAADGSHSLTAVARDAAGNSTTSSAISVTVDNAAPTVSVTSPADQATVSGTISVTADATDNIGVVGVQFKLDGADLGAEDTTSPYSVDWDTTTATDDAHTLTAVARDAAGNATTSATVNVTVDNAGGGVLTYDDWVAGFAPNVVSYWKFQNTGADEQGTQDATITGSPELNVPTIVDLDTIAEGAAADGEVIAWSGGTGEYAEAAHNAAHKTAAGTIVVTFQLDSLSEKSTLLAADSNSAAGGLSVEVTTDGSSRAFLKNASGSAVILTGVAGDVQLNQAYTQIFKWGTSGLSLALYNDAGTLVRRVTDTLTDGVTGTSTIRFGAWHTDVSHHDGPYGRAVWLNRRIGDAEEADLARAKTITHGGGAPNAPSGLSATAVSSSQINLSWTDNSSNETGFKIERKTGAGGTYSQIDTVAADVTSYNNTGLAASTTYYYRVRATNSSGNSSYSNEANATTQASSGSGITIPELAYQTITDSVPGSNVCWWNPTSGNDSNDGLTKANAKLTFAAAEAVVSAGGSIIVTGGAIGSTTYHAVPTIVPSKSGTVGNPIILRSEPDRKVVLIRENTFLFALTHSASWTLVDSGNQIWESPNLGISDGATTVSDTGSFTNAITGSLKIPDGGPTAWFMLIPWVGTDRIAQNGTSGWIAANNAYPGPWVASMGNGRIRLRMEKPKAGVAGNHWPNDGRMGSIIAANRTWQEPQDTNPNNHEIRLIRHTSAGTNLILFDFNGQSNWRIYGLNGDLHSMAVRLNNAQNIKIEKGTFFTTKSFAQHTGNTRGFTVTRCRIVTGAMNHIVWSETKTSGRYYSTNLLRRELNSASGTTSGDTMRDLLYEHCTTFGWFDIILPPSNSLGPWEFAYCAMRAIYDDGAQVGMPASGGFHVHHCYWEGPFGGPNNNNKGTVRWHIHHNVFNHRVPAVWGGNVVNMHSLMPNHNSGSNGPVMPLSFYHNTCYGSPDDRWNRGTMVPLSNSGKNIDSGTIEAWNNIFAMVDTMRYNPANTNDFVARHWSTEQSSAGTQRSDYNIYFRSVPNAGSVLFRQYQTSQGTNREDFASLTAWRDSGKYTQSASMYSDGTAGHEEHSVQQDPQFVDLAARDYRPQSNGATSGAKNLTSTGWPGTGTFQDWKGALNPAGSGSEVGPQNP